VVLHYKDDCVCIVYLVLVWHCIDTSVFGYYKCMVVTSVVLYFLGFVHRFFLY
jgi:hypothetical protein